MSNPVFIFQTKDELILSKSQRALYIQNKESQGYTVQMNAVKKHSTGYLYNIICQRSLDSETTQTREVMPMTASEITQYTANKMQKGYECEWRYIKTIGTDCIYEIVSTLSTALTLKEVA